MLEIVDENDEGDAEIAEMTGWFEAHTISRHGRYHLVEPSIVVEDRTITAQLAPTKGARYQMSLFLNGRYGAVVNCTECRDRT